MPAIPTHNRQRGKNSMFPPSSSLVSSASTYPHYQEPTSTRSPTSVPERGRGRGRGEGIGRGRGRGIPRPEAEMTASGPFALGPALAGNNARRSTPRSNFAPSISPSKLDPSPAASLTRTEALSLKVEADLKRKGKGKAAVAEDDELYSEPDEGVEIVDMENVRQMDWMAPDSLRKEFIKKVKKDEPAQGTGKFIWLSSYSSGAHNLGCSDR